VISSEEFSNLLDDPDIRKEYDKFLDEQKFHEAWQAALEEENEERS
jgi:hypothetical protein